MPIDELLRFKDLQRLNVVKSWPQLRYMQRHYGFPEGILLGENTRAWAACQSSRVARSPTNRLASDQRARRKIGAGPYGAEHRRVWSRKADISAGLAVAR